MKSSSSCPCPDTGSETSCQQVTDIPLVEIVGEGVLLYMLFNLICEEHYKQDNLKQCAVIVRADGVYKYHSELYEKKRKRLLTSKMFTSKKDAKKISNDAKTLTDEQKAAKGNEGEKKIKEKEEKKAGKDKELNKQDKDKAKEKKKHDKDEAKKIVEPSVEEEEECEDAEGRKVCTCAALLAVPLVVIEPEGDFSYIMMKLFCQEHEDDAPPCAVVIRSNKTQFLSDRYMQLKREFIDKRIRSTDFGGGRITINPAEKTILVYGANRVFGPADLCTAVRLLKEAYPDYDVSFQNIPESW